jgi:glutathione synthase/RimK-type ligase-like ATP-grasp enzyme
MILVLTNERDLTSDYVVLELRRRGLPFVRLNSERLSEGYVTFDPALGVDGWLVELDGMRLDFRSVRAAYFRRPGSPGVPAGVVREDAGKYCRTEWGAALSSALNSLGNRWLNAPLAIMAAEDKPRQLALATSLGFRVPPTAISNRLVTVSDRLADGPVVAKPLREALLEGHERERVMFTSRVPDLSEVSEEAVAAAPAIFQRQIEKKSDIRVTVVAEHAYAAEILSQDLVETCVDWRRGSHPELVHRAHALPALLEERCVSLVNALGLRFGAVDLVLDRSDDYWFLEINPNGQWAWIENRTGLPLTQAIVDELERIAE